MPNRFNQLQAMLRHSIEGGHTDPWSAGISGFKGQTYGSQKFGFQNKDVSKMDMKITLSQTNILLMAEILHHLGCMKPYK